MCLITLLSANDTPNQANTLLWTKLGQTLAKTLVKPLVTPCHSGTFIAFSKFHLNTSNSTNTKVV
jgi:hypothetical protein